MIGDKNRIYDGWFSLEGGVDAGRDPEMIDLNQVVSAENMTFRGGKGTTRPGFRLMLETFPPIGSPPNLKQVYCYGQAVGTGPTYHPEGEYADSTTIDPTRPEFANQNSEYIYRNGVFQGAIAFSPHNNSQDCIMAMIGGRLFRIIPGSPLLFNNTVPPPPPGPPPPPQTPDVPTAGTGVPLPPSRTPLTSVDADNIGAVTPVPTLVDEIIINDQNHPYLRNRNDLTLAYMVQADKFLFIQDGDSRCIIYDAVSARRANTTATKDNTEVPTGTIMAYGMGRLCVVVNDRDIAFGDLYGSHDLPDPADSIKLFTERNFLAGGFDAAIPFQQGVVTGLSFFPQLDTSTGNGQLLAFAERGAAAFFLSLDRQLWQTSQFQILALLTTGMRGHRSISVVNEDLWFRSDDGVRSYRQARSEPTGWAHIPLSTNVKQFLQNDSDWMLKYASSAYFDNRILFTTSPIPNQGRPINGGFAVVDFDILSSFRGQDNPSITKAAWDGHWTFPFGIGVMQVLTGVFNGVTRAFVFCLVQGQNVLFEISEDDVDDWLDQKIEWEMVSRAFDFQKFSQQSTAFNEVELYDADVWMKGIIE